MKVNEASFREVYHQICYISNGENFKSFADLLPHSSEATGVLAYGYIDHQAGLTFEILSCVKIEDDGSLTVFDGVDDVTLKYRVGSISECELYFIDDDNISSLFVDKIKMVNEGYKTTKGVESTRELTVIDESRSPEYPDDVMVVLFYGDNQPEGCWVRCEGLGEGCIKGRLLNEPNSDFKVHCGDIIEFGVLRSDEGLMCVAVIE